MLIPDSESNREVLFFASATISRSAVRQFAALVDTLLCGEAVVEKAPPEVTLEETPAPVPDDGEVDAEEDGANDAGKSAESAEVDDAAREEFRRCFRRAKDMTQVSMAAQYSRRLAERHLVRLLEDGRKGMLRNTADVAKKVCEEEDITSAEYETTRRWGSLWRNITKEKDGLLPFLPGIGDAFAKEISRTSLKTYLAKLD